MEITFSQKIIFAILMAFTHFFASRHVFYYKTEPTKTLV